ncbi:hypothetical protein RhiirA4_454795 [Rhizophagus irregularis]|uniref:Uncharacterized protein n=1 Tax=Rhizophagus irregularis TaxID=588596 RepID=A0A2I1G3Q1_9GLOM|nr:hypothetical protein RhiirA4_454795 [Rhizophagus irregularis]
MELDKSFTREHILEALQELLSQNEIVSRSQTDTLPNQSVHSRPVHFEKSILREEIAEQSGGIKVMPSFQVMPLKYPSKTTPAIPAIESSFMSYAILTLFLLIVIWIVGKKIWDSWKKSNTEYSFTKNGQFFEMIL